MLLAANVSTGINQSDQLIHSLLTYIRVNAGKPGSRLREPAAEEMEAAPEAQLGTGT